MELTERLLNDAGGWQTMKQARALHERGRVLAATWEPPLLQGRVKEGETEFRSGLKIFSRTNVENLCSCRPSRQYGSICAHAVAIGLEFLKPQAKAAPAPAPTAAPAKQAEPQRPESFSTDAGEPVEIAVILPPNLAASWEKGSVTAAFEAIRGGKRIPLNTLDAKGKYRCSEADLKLVRTIRAMANGELAGMAMLPREKFLELLEGLREHPRVTMGRSTTALVSDRPVLPELAIQRQPDGSATIGARLPKGPAYLMGATRSWQFDGNTFREVAPGLPVPYRELLQRDVKLPADAAGKFLQRELPALKSSFAFELPEEAAAAPAVARARPDLVLDLEGSLNHLVARLGARYGEHRLVLPSSQRTSFPRDFAYETEAADRLRSSGFAGPDAKGEFILKGEPKILSFFARELPRWQRDAEVQIGARFQHVTASVERIQPRVEIRGSGENWFDLHFELATASGDRFSSTEIQRLLQSGQTHLRRKNGQVAVFDPGMIEEFQQVLQDCDPQQQQPGSYRIHQRHAAYLQAMATDTGAELKAPNHWISTATASRNVEQMRPVPLGSLEDTLRPYQKHGVYWMNFLAKNGLGGILADEMGLGKTVQTLAFLRALGGKALIVCPSSLIFNWQREVERFTPDRRVLAIEGSNRQALFGQPLEQADIAITSYPLLRRDADLYRGREFDVVVLDEAQHIKNPDSQNAQAAFSIRGRHRFVLTGTPIENSVRDLWSLMHFLMPGYLGSRQDFRDRYEKVIADQPTGPEQQRLVKRIRPFVLRRTKRAVASELPEKIEQVAYCEMTSAQQQLYSELLSSARRQITELSADKDQKKARMLMFTALLRLRQACCDLRLLGQEEGASAKVDLFDELLEEAIDGGHRVLIFSQFVGMLHLLRDRLETAGVDFCYLDGSTKDRAAQVDRFQAGQTPVFLISLKAGGTGLNLTAADTVFIFDPWWNPAVEAQAADRAHRMGQEKVVTVYRLITRNSVEEKILQLQAKKRQVVDATIESEEPMMTGLTLKDIEGLLE